LPEFMVNEINFQSENKIVIDHIEIKKNNDKNCIAYISGIRMVDNSKYILSLKEKEDKYNKYTYYLSKEDNAKVYVYFTEPINEKINLYCRGNFYMTQLPNSEI